MNRRLKQWVSATLVGAVIALSCASSAEAAPSKTITIGWTAWSDAEFVTKMTQQLIESHFHYNVKLRMAAVGVQYQGVADGNLDFMMMAWLPDTQAAYYNKVKNKVVDLGPLYKNARVGWVVPDYIPKSQLNSITDLKKPDVAKKLDGKIQGIDPGAGEMQSSEKAMKAYNLTGQYRLVSASGAAMTAALARAEKNHQWIVVTGWTPHWMFGKWHLRFLKDPKDILGPPQHVDVLARKGFKKDYPKVAEFLSNIHIPLNELQAGMYEARQTSYQQAIQHFIKQHQKLVNSWYPKNS